MGDLRSRHSHSRDCERRNEEKDARVTETNHTHTHAQCAAACVHRGMLVIGRPWARNYFSEPFVLRKVPKVCFGGKIKRHAEVMIYPERTCDCQRRDPNWTSYPKKRTSQWDLRKGGGTHACRLPSPVSSLPCNSAAVEMPARRWRRGVLKDHHKNKVQWALNERAPCRAKW